MVGHSRTNTIWAFQTEQKLIAEKYYQQLDNLKTVVQEKRPAMFNKKDIIQHHDIDRPHAALGIRQKIAVLDCEILWHPQYSPDLVHSDYHLFLSLQNFWRAENSKMKKISKKRWFNFFHEKMKHFSKIGFTYCPHADK